MIQFRYAERHLIDEKLELHASPAAHFLSLITPRNKRRGFLNQALPVTAMNLELSKRCGIY
ncbi:hypothetical protein V513_12410 [Mesotoga sp. H07.pep.5.3]|nr:hypothetical protein V513_12410 [Mesotoga sp. H07.pep.5.3]